MWCSKCKEEVFIHALWHVFFSLQGPKVNAGFMEAPFPVEKHFSFSSLRTKGTFPLGQQMSAPTQHPALSRSCSSSAVCLLLSFWRFWALVIKLLLPEGSCICLIDVSTPSQGKGERDGSGRRQHLQLWFQWQKGTDVFIIQRDFYFKSAWKINGSLGKSIATHHRQNLLEHKTPLGGQSQIMPVCRRANEPVIKMEE